MAVRERRKPLRATVKYLCACSWVEHDPNEILQSVHDCIEGALRSATDSGKKLSIVAVGITNQRETTLVWDKLTGKPLYNAIAWYDSRTLAICQAIQKEKGSGVNTCFWVQ